MEINSISSDLSPVIAHRRKRGRVQDAPSLSTPQKEEMDTRIQEHAFHRITLAFLQATALYKQATSHDQELRFGPAIGQYGSGHNGNQAAHRHVSSGVYVDGKPYLMGRRVQRLLDSTDSLPADVNRVDSALEKSIRPRLQPLLNQVFHGLITPVEYTAQVFSMTREHFQEAIKSASERYVSIIQLQLDGTRPLEETQATTTFSPESKSRRKRRPIEESKLQEHLLGQATPRSRKSQPQRSLFK